MLRSRSTRSFCAAISRILTSSVCRSATDLQQLVRMLSHRKGHWACNWAALGEGQWTAVSEQVTGTHVVLAEKWMKGKAWT